MRKIKLMADYECYPLWEEFSDGVDNIAPSSLPISEHLAKKVGAWGDVYEKTLNHDDPASSSFSSQEAMTMFETEGRKLHNELKLELGSQFTVAYFSTLSNSLIS